MFNVLWNLKCFQAEWVGREGKGQEVCEKIESVNWWYESTMLMLESFLCPWPLKSPLDCLPSGPYFQHIDPEWNNKKNTLLFGLPVGWGEWKVAPFHNIISLHLLRASPLATEMEDHKPKGLLRNQNWKKLERESKKKWMCRDGDGSWSQSLQGE